MNFLSLERFYRIFVIDKTGTALHLLLLGHLWAPWTVSFRIIYSYLYYYELFGFDRRFSNRTRAHIHQTLWIRLSGYFFEYSSRTECVVFVRILFHSVRNRVFGVVLEWRRVTRVRLFIGFVFTTQKHTHTHTHPHTTRAKRTTSSWLWRLRSTSNFK